MELEKSLPQTLVRAMSDMVELAVYDDWRKSDSAASISSSLAMPATYDAQRSLWHRPGSQKDFESAINYYFQQSDYKVDPKWSTWEGVLEQLDSATAIYNQKARRNTARAILRNKEVVSRNIIHLLEAIPNDNGLGLLKGGLLVVFHAVKRRSDACEKVFHCFKLVPDMLGKAHRSVRLFPQDKGARAYMDDFHGALTTSIPQLIRILIRHESENRFVRMGKIVLGDQVKDVDACVRSVDDAHRKLEDYIRSLESIRDAQTARKTDNIDSSLNVVRSSVFELCQEVNSLRKGLEGVREVCASVREGQSKHTLDENSMKISMMMINDLHRMFTEGHRNRALNHEETPQLPWETLAVLPPEQAARDSPTPGPNSDDLLEALGGDFICWESLNDNEEILRKSHQFSDRALRQAAYLKSTPRFQRWLGDTASGILLVDGHDTRGRISAMSVFCSMLVRALRTMQEQATSQIQTIVLFFTCGAHTDKEDILAGPCGIVRSLIGQLLESWPDQAPDLAFLNEVDGLLFDIQEDRIDALCYLFQELVRQLPPETVVFCVVDGVSMYETSYLNRKDDLNYLVEVLLDLTSASPMHEAPSPVTKVLLASADKSTDAYRLLRSEDCVDLRAQNQLPSTPTQRSLLGDIQHTLQPEG